MFSVAFVCPRGWGVQFHPISPRQAAMGPTPPPRKDQLKLILAKVTQHAIEEILAKFVLVIYLLS